MKKQLKQSVSRKRQQGIKFAVPVIIILIWLAGVLGALLFNTLQLKRTLRQNTVAYANDVSAQLAGHISYRMQTREVYIRNLADTFSRTPKTLLTEELLDRKAEYLEMADIFVINADGTTIPANVEHAGLEQYLSEHPELYTDAGIFFAERNEEVFFSAPIIRQDGETSILIGVRSNALLQQMLQNADFKNQGLSCIVNQDGTVIVSATDEAPFLELNDLFSQNATKEDLTEAQRVLEDISAHRSGVAKFSDVGGENILLGYNFLGINDWMLLTLVTADLFSENTTPYLVRYIMIIGVLFFVMLAILFFVVWYYHRALEYIRGIALTDPLTGGQNSLGFRLDCEKNLRENPERDYAIVYLNIRDFKQINEYFGVKRGDELLRQIYRILSENLSKGELVSRISGDHFYLLLECADEIDVKKRLGGIMEQLESRLSEQFSFAQLSFDQGAYLIADRDADLMLLSDRAKVASAYQLENNDCRFYDAELKRQLEREHLLDASFRRAVENHEFKLYIQPKISPDRQTVCSGEVLIRWEHPEFGLLSPGEFIPLFERNGKICDLDFYVFKETCRLWKDWFKRGIALPLSVNLSRAHLILKDFSFLDDFQQIKDAYRIPDGQIELELTESLLMERRDIPIVISVTERIRKMGFLCSIDDFGFGYSSLTMLKDMSVNTVKLDRQFFLDESGKSWMVVDHLIRLTHELGMTVVAEGIESPEQVEKLRACGCDLIQGYVYAKPMKIDDFESWCASYTTQGQQESGHKI